MNSTPRFFYLRSTPVPTPTKRRMSEPKSKPDKGKPIGLIALQRIGDQVRISASFCNPKDTWNRDLARRIALGRLEEGRKSSCIITTIGKMDDLDLPYIVLYFGSTFYPSEEEYNRFEVAKNWLFTKEEIESQKERNPFSLRKDRKKVKISLDGGAKNDVFCVSGSVRTHKIKSEKPTPRHFFLRDQKGAPFGIVAMNQINNEVRVSASFISPKDTWNHDLGLRIAFGRLEKLTSSLPAVLVSGEKLTAGDLVAFYNASVDWIDTGKFDFELQKYCETVQSRSNRK